MYRRSFLPLLPVLLALILLPQLLYFWLVPANAAARLVVYGFGTALTLASPAAAFVTHYLYGLRRSIGVAITAYTLELATILVCAILLAVDAAARTALFALAVTTLAYVICLVPMVVSVARSEDDTPQPADPTDPQPHRPTAPADPTPCDPTIRASVPPSRPTAQVTAPPYRPAPSARRESNAPTPTPPPIPRQRVQAGETPPPIPRRS